MSNGRRGSKKKNTNLILFLAIVAIALAVIFGLNFNKKEVKIENSQNETVEVDTKASDKVAPEIKYEEKTVLAVGEEYKIKATAKDDVDGDISSQIKASTIDTSSEGEFEVTLSVSDKAGNKTEKKQKVIVRNALSNGLPVLMYHFFYDNEKYFKQDNNWLKVSEFEEQLKYMTENNFYFPTWEEVNDYIDGKIKLPSKSVVLTVDDGDDSFFDLAVPLMQKYKVPATIFVITEWYGHKYNSELEYVSWQSHSAQMHESGANGKGRIVNWTYDQILEDLKTSCTALGGKATVFCYPFGHYNDTAIKALKDSPFKMAFTIEGGRVYKGSSKYTLPRVRVADGNSMNYFISSIS